MCMLWHNSAIPVCFHLSTVFFPAFRVCQILNIIPDIKHKLVCHKLFLHKIEHQCIGHLTDNDFCLVKIIRTMKHLTGTDTVCLRLISLNIRNCDRLIPPGMIDQKLCINAKHFIKKLFVIIISLTADGTACNIAHRIKSGRF